ncbi:HEPN domain-containing protein [Mucilaginibacter gossypii]|uniref:Uncharacterized protein n=1 Tax=Mucilaginibacter gossypii TaxID=551996 RepID=A0A1G8CY74_9SPHI|nr:HEPN domain-containing protein [Mucilaginibacter gossypii]SDH49860.1 hypothetical protein SAMN05192573_11060 [Mucilaginibacter gossypii]
MTRAAGNGILYNSHPHFIAYRTAIPTFTSKQYLVLMELTTGYFWDPIEKDVKVFGEMTVNESGDRFDLKLYGMVKCLEGAMWHINYHEAIAVLHGFTTSKECLSLFNLRVEHYENLSHETDPHALSRKSTVITMRFESYILSSNHFFLGNEEFRCPQLKFLPQFSEELDEDGNFSSNYENVRFTDDDFLEKRGDSLSYKLHGRDGIEIPYAGGQLHYTGSFGSLPLMPRNILHIEKNYCFRFKFSTPLTFSDLHAFLKKNRAFFTLMTGTYLALEEIRIDAGQPHWHTFNGSFNKRNTYYPGGFPPKNRMLYLTDLITGDYFNIFLDLYPDIELPLRHYLNFIENDKDDPEQDLLSLVAALEIMFNKTHQAVNSQIGELSKVATEVLALPGIKSHQRDFLLEFRKGTKLKAFRIRDKLTKLIDDSETLTKLVKDSGAFTEKVLSARHYLVHEADMSNNELISNILMLRKANMKLKIILEYYLLLYLKIPKDTIEERIYLILPNHVQYMA